MTLQGKSSVVTAASHGQAGLTGGLRREPGGATGGLHRP